MEEQKLIQMIRFDHDLVVFIEGSDDQQRQVNDLWVCHAIKQ